MAPPSSGQRICIRVDKEMIRERHSVLIHDPARRQKQEIITLSYFNCSPSNIYRNVFVKNVKISVNQKVRFLFVLH